MNMAKYVNNPAVNIAKNPTVNIAKYADNLAVNIAQNMLITLFDIANRLMTLITLQRTLQKICY